MTKLALSPKQRLKLLERVFKNGESVSSTCRDFSVSRFTFYKWAKRYDPKASRNTNLKNLVDVKRKAVKSAKLASDHVIEDVKRIASDKPHWSKYKIADELKKRFGERAVGVHGVYNVLRRTGLNTLEARKKWQEFVLNSKKRVLTPEQRLEVIKKAEELGTTVAKVCRDFGISRHSYYKWKRRWEKSGRKDDALRDRVPQYDRGYLRVKPELEKEILSIVIEFPNLSKYGIARKIAEKLGPVVGPHGIYNVLLRRGLNRPEERVLYSSARVPEVAAPETWTDRLRYVLEQFVPTYAPAPPPAGPLALWAGGLASVLRFLRTFSLASILSSATIYSFLWWINLLAAQVASVSLGLVFASIALLLGSLFFLYSLKYYITLAIVLSFSQQEPEIKAKKRGFVSWLLGITSGKETPEKEIEKPIGLTPSLEHISLRRQPYVSVQIPLYNEKRVVERILKSATAFDYPNYEVILCDDSTDETSQIIQDYILKSSKQHVASRKGNNKSHATNYKLHTTKGEGWTLTQVEVRPGVTLKHLHRTSRSGYKGGALKLALKHCDPKTEFVSVFDADFVPYPDTLELFLKYFQATAGTLDFGTKSRITNNQLPMTNELKNDSSDKLNENWKLKIDHSQRIAAVQGYQWHVLNKSENWITRGVRSEYAGSYVIERSGEEIYGGLKQISGAVYMIRKDVLEEVGWNTSITEDFELTLKLYEKGYKVVYTPYIQAPAECVSTLSRLIRQRMRWAEGHSNNIKKMFLRLVFSKNLSFAEKLEFFYLSPYYLQAFFFLIGTLAWLISETLFPAQLPFWTSLWGWSLVLTNIISLPLMNAVGLFLEESEERDYQGLISFVALTYILVPFQAYAALKGFLEHEEGPWFRTPKTGIITDVFTRGRFYRFISGILPGRSQPEPPKPWGAKAYLSLISANNKFDSFSLKPKNARWIGKTAFALSLSLVILLVSLSPYIRSGIENFENKAGLKIPEISAKRNNFRLDEFPEFVLDIGEDSSSDNKISWVSKAQAAEALNVETIILYRNEPVDIPVVVSSIGDGRLAIKLEPIESLLPGKYTLKTFVGEVGQKVITTQDFTWGVLAINTNKSIYLSGETAKLAFAVLDDSGEMVCTASLKLKIQNANLGIDDELSTGDGTIKVNEECSKKQKTAKPDYEAEYLIGEPGVYSLELIAETFSGERLIKDSFEVRSIVPFEIERFSPTRIFPTDNYTVELKIKVNEDFNGQVIETVPASFEITSATPTSEVKDFTTSEVSGGETRLIFWKVDWKRGRTYELSYEFKAPNISPAFYMLGPIQLTNKLMGPPVFKETRRWQIASDATNLLVNASTSGITDAPAAWADITGLTGSASVASTGSVVILIAHVPQELTGTDEVAEYRFTVDGSATGSPILTSFSDNSNEGNSLSMVWAVDNLSAASHDFAVQWQRVTGVAQTHTSLTRSLQVIEIEDNASIIIDQSNSAGSADPASWANIPSLSATVTPTASSLHLFIADIQPAGASDSSSDIQFAVAGTRDGPMSSLWTDASDDFNGTGMMWAQTGLAASSQALSVQWQARQGSLTLDSGRPSIFQVVEITDNFALPVDIEITSSDTSDGTYNDITGMSGSATPDSSDSVMLFFGAGVMASGGDAGADLSLSYNGTEEGAELTTFRDETNGVPGYLITRAKTGITGSQTFSLEWTTRGSAIGTDTGRERTFQVIDFQTVSTDVTVSSIGNQVTSMTITSTDNNVGASGAGGGAFVITENTSSRNVTGITITENGTVDALNDVDNIRLYSENDTSAPYDCAGESFSGFPSPTENQYGSTDTSGFSAEDGTSAFTETIAISTTSTLCIYVVVDITTGATNNETLLVEIDAPNTEVTVSAGTVGPTSSVLLTGSTELQTPSDLDQERYRWRNDNGGETAGALPQVTATLDATTGSSTDVAMSDMSITPGAGDYLVWFSGSVGSDTVNRRIFVSIYVGGTQVGHTEREIFVEGSYDSSSFVVNTLARELSVGATEAIEVYWRFTGGTGQAVVHERALTIERVTPANSNQASATANDTRNVDTYAQMDSMTITPGAGDYLVWFSGSLETDSSTAVTLASIFVGGVQVTHTERQLDSDSSYPDSSVPIASNARILSVGASDAIEIRWRTSAGIATVHERTLVVQKINSGNTDIASATLDDTHNTDTYTLMDSMSITPGVAGDYLVWFSGSVESDTANTTTLISIFVGGTQVAYTERETFTDGSGLNYSYPGVSTHALVSGVGASDAIEVRWRTSAGIAAVHERTLVIQDMFVQHEGTTLTGSSNASNVVTVASVPSTVDQVYLASIAIYEELAQISTVTGGSGLTWSLQKRQCADRINEPFVEVWQAFGSPGSSFTVTATSDTNPSARLSMAVSHYSGADVVTPTEGKAGSNTVGQNGACDLSGTDNSNATLSLTSTIDDSVFYVATHSRNGTISTADVDYTQRAFISNSSGGDGANLYVHDRTLAAAGTDSADHTLAADKPWDMAGLVINPMSLGGVAATFVKAEDTSFTDFPRLTTYRLRFLVNNQGGLSSGNVTYRIQVAQTATCASGSYADVPTDGSGHWDIVDSTNITDGEATEDISPGLTNPGGGTFKAGELRDNTSNTTGNIDLAEAEFTEIEFALQATNNSVDLANYCFRLYDSTGATALDNYTNYGEAVVVPEYTWIFFGLGPLLPGAIAIIKRKRNLKPKP